MTLFILSFFIDELVNIYFHNTHNACEVEIHLIMGFYGWMNSLPCDYIVFFFFRIISAQHDSIPPPVISKSRLQIKVNS